MTIYLLDLSDWQAWSLIIRLLVNSFISWFCKPSSIDGVSVFSLMGVNFPMSFADIETVGSGLRYSLINSRTSASARERFVENSSLLGKRIEFRSRITFSWLILEFIFRSLFPESNCMSLSELNFSELVLLAGDRLFVSSFGPVWRAATSES